MEREMRVPSHVDGLTLVELRDFAALIAEEAGELVESMRSTRHRAEYKPDGSHVTEADRQAELLLRRRIADRFPMHEILGEEHGYKQSDSPFRWVLDPIDGTRSYVAGIPLYTVLVAVLYKGYPVVGIIHNPATHETAAGLDGQATLLNGVSIHVSETERLDEAMLCVTDPSNFIRRQGSGAVKLLRTVKQCRTWADGYGYLLVASGRVDAMIDPIMNPWDIAALKPVIEGAGGRFTDIAGEVQGMGTSSVAAPPRLHAELLDVLG